MASDNVAQSGDTSIKGTITEIDMTVQTAQKEGEALVAGIQALIRDKDGTHTANLRCAEALCERLDSVLCSLMNDVNCMAERHQAHYMGDVHV